MLNKELLMVTGGKPEQYTKLTVGTGSNHYGYSSDKDIMGIFGSMSKETSWTFNGKDCSIWGFTSYGDDTSLLVNYPGEIQKYLSEIIVTVVEKNLKVAFKDINIFGYAAHTVLFTPNDVGKTFTIGFDPPPDSYN